MPPAPSRRHSESHAGKVPCERRQGDGAMSVHSGGCHCGNIRLSFSTPLGSGRTGNPRLPVLVLHPAWLAGGCRPERPPDHFGQGQSKAADLLFRPAHRRLSCLPRMRRLCRGDRRRRRRGQGDRHRQRARRSASNSPANRSLSATTPKRANSAWPGGAAPGCRSKSRGFESGRSRECDQRMTGSPWKRRRDGREMPKPISIIRRGIFAGTVPMWKPNGSSTKPRPASPVSVTGLCGP